MNRTSIEYLINPDGTRGFTWNPIAMRCTKVGPGCKNCWHLRMANRMSYKNIFSGEVSAAYAGGPPALVESRLEEPLKRKKPSVIAAQYMGDLFHKDVPLEWVEKIYLTMKRAVQHTFLLLTKRPDRMATAINVMNQTWGGGYHAKPLPNVWLGVSVENSDYVWRIDELMKCSAAVRFMSAEPLLGGLMNLPCLYARDVYDFHCDSIEEFPDGRLEMKEAVVTNVEFVPSLDWVIIGCESGPGARPMNEDWVRDIRDQCIAADVPLFYKQKMGGGKLISMPLLDGRKWDEMPRREIQ